MAGPPRARSPPDLALRRQYSNNQERIEGILETARRRSIAMANTNDPALHALTRHSSSPGSLSPLHNPDSPPGISPGRASTRALEGILAETESSADEETSIVRRDSQRKKHRDYLSTADSANLRARRSSQTSIRRVASIPSSSRTEAVEAPAEPAAAATVAREDGSRSWWKNTFARYKSIELENKGSVARDHLALERTFLAWLRTSLGFASIGIAVTQLFRLSASTGTNPPTGQYTHLRQIGKPLGATFLAISIIVLFMGFHRYFESQHWIIKGKFPASRGSIFLVALLAVILMFTSLVVVLVIGPNSYEN